MMRMCKVSFQNVTRIKSFQIWLKSNYENDMEKMMCHYKNNVVMQLFYNDSNMIISNLIWVQTDIIITCKDLS
jgi:hypothetical protein